MAVKASSSTPGRLLRYALVGVVGYGVLFLAVYLFDYLGLSPVLDARENLAWAERIADGNLPAEPMYRALLYPALLSIVPMAQVLAPVLGLCCHLMNALLCGLIAGRIWGRRPAVLLTGMTYAVYPVSLYFSVQILDITFALTWFLAAVGALLFWPEKQARRWLVFAGACAGIAVLARPNFLPAVIMMPVLVPLLGWKWRRSIATLLGDTLLLSLMFVGCLLLQGYVSWSLSGNFRMLPWQGAYNLYAANRDGANGKFYKQSVVFDSIPEGMNPARMESEYLYRLEVGETADLEVEAMSEFWRSKLIDELEAEPVRWLSLMARKVVYILNDWEQYNNMTYAYHKDRFAALKWNPLGWGVLLIATVASLFLNRRWWLKPGLWALLILASAYAAGVLLFYVSARFRLPLAPIFCVLLGGLGSGSIAPLRQAGLVRLVSLLTLCLATGVLTYGSWFDARDRASYIQDEILLAGAAVRAGNDAGAVEWADLALNRDARRDDARRIQVVALYNLWMVSSSAEEFDKYEATIRQSLDLLGQDDAAIAFISGVWLWRGGAVDVAIQQWQSAVSRFGESAGFSVLALETVKAQANGFELTGAQQELWSVLTR